MSDEPKRISEREAILRERAAFAAGAKWTGWFEWQRATIEAAGRYALPKITRARVATDDGIGGEWTGRREWRYLNGELQSRTVGLCRTTGFPFPWTNTAQCRLTAKRVAIWADLMVHPTETVEDGE